MLAARPPRVSTIPIHRPFADALAAGLLARARGDRLALARMVVLLPSSRAIRTLTDAFVRRAGGGLLLPRLAALGDPALDETVGALFDPAGAADPVPPAIDPVARQLILARLVSEARAAAGRAIEAGEAVRLAAELARTLDQLIVEEVPPARLAEAVPAELAVHWQSSLAELEVVLRRWPQELGARGRIDLAERRNRLLDATAARWAAAPPPTPIVAAGITAAGPAAARLLRVVARLPQGQVVLPALDRAMPEPEWQALLPDGDAAPIETHPQYALRLLLDRMGVARGEVGIWRHGGGGGSSAARGRAIHNALAPAVFTDKWQRLAPAARRLSGVRAQPFATPAHEAQGIAVALRTAIETPGRTAALVTPDRVLAARVSALLRRWGIEADDSAGRALGTTAPGTLLRAIADAGAEAFAPVPLLALLKHPLVQPDRRADWLGEVRLLDRALRGPRPAPGLAGVTRHLEGEARHAAALTWWRGVVPLLAPLEAAFAVAEVPFAAALAVLRDTVAGLAGDHAWSRPAGRAAAALVAGMEAVEGGLATVAPRALPGLLAAMLDTVAVRPPQGGHPRVSIWGLIEARLAQADLLVLGGLNEGVWPAPPAPDPWLAPAIRHALGLPGLERRIGAEAEQFAAALGAREVLLTRARRDARAPAVASRFWLRLEAMTGGVAPARAVAAQAAALDRPAGFAPAARPRPAPPAADRPRRIAVTKLDRLKADPFAFYADAMLRLRRWDGVDADPSAAWRGSAVHRVFEEWIKLDRGEPARLRPRAEALLAATAAHPVLRTLWTPRLLEAIDWIADQVAVDRAAGRVPLVAECKGRLKLGEVTLEGTADRIDRLADGGLAIVDWKTGKPPSRRAVAEGYSLQLGLLGLIAQEGGFGAALTATPEVFEYWSLGAGRDGTLGYRQSPVGGDARGGTVIAPGDFPDHARRVLDGAIAAYLLGEAPFVAKLHPDYAPYGDYDQLMRLDEWYGRAAPEPAP